MIILFFASKWLIDGAFFRKDIVINTAPIEGLYGIIQRSGESPLWAPELAGGYPLLAGGHIEKRGDDKKVVIVPKGLEYEAESLAVR